MNEKTKALLEKNPFAEALAELHGGVTISELTDALQQLTQAVTLTGGKGNITVTIAMRSRGTGLVEMSAEPPKVKIPRPGKHSTVFFVDEKNRLTRSDPNQKELQFPAPATAGGS